jgi:hypothetical protein
VASLGQFACDELTKKPSYQNDKCWATCTEDPQAHVVPGARPCWILALVPCGALTHVRAGSTSVVCPAAAIRANKAGHASGCQYAAFGVDERRHETGRNRGSSAEGCEDKGGVHDGRMR